MRRSLTLLLLFLALAWSAAGSSAPQAPDAPADPLPSWNDGKAKQALLAFVKDVTDPKSKKFVRPEDRIATFDNDGTLWSEQPVYFQVFFALDRVRELAPKHPDWKDKQPYKAALSGDLADLRKLDLKEWEALIASTHAGMTEGDFQKIVADWFKTAKHPTLKRPFNDLVYQPQLELLAHLRANGFQTWICSGGGIDFIRNFAEKTYGVVPERVIGTDLLHKYEKRDGKPVLMRTAQLVEPINDHAGKPVGIHRHIGRRPILAFGNSDGDQEMLEYTDTGDRPRLMLLLHHDDAEREWKYDRESPIGRLDKAWDEAKKRGWLVVSMKDDFKVIYPFQK